MALPGQHPGELRPGHGCRIGQGAEAGNGTIEPMEAEAARGRLVGVAGGELQLAGPGRGRREVAGEGQLAIVEVHREGAAVFHTAAVDRSRRRVGRQGGVPALDLALERLVAGRDDKVEHEGLGARRGALADQTQRLRRRILGARRPAERQGRGPGHKPASHDMPSKLGHSTAEWPGRRGSSPSRCWRRGSSAARCSAARRTPGRRPAGPPGPG